MKKYIAFIISISYLSVNSQVLFTYGKKSVTKQEFLAAFNKNPTPANERASSLLEYKTLYPNYKLKVQSALDDKLDETETYKVESGNFKRQITDNVITQEANGELLFKEAFERSQKDVHVSQIFIANDKSKNAELEIRKAHAELKQGKDFDKILQQYCNDESVKANKGELGFITVFTLPYEIENLVYTTKVNSFTAPFKSKFGWHIFKVNSTRPAVGRRKIAQILLTFPPNANDSTKQAITNQANDLYKRIKNGENFGELAQKFSADYTSASNNGEIGEVGVARFDKQFEEKIYSLKVKDEVSQPFNTAYGIHILKLLEIYPVSNNINDPVFSSTLKLTIENSARLADAKKNLVKNWMTKIGYRKAYFNEKQAFEYIDSVVANKPTAQFFLVNDKTLLFSFQKQDYTLKEFADAVKAAKYSGTANANKSYNELLSDFEEEMASTYYREHIEEYNANMQKQLKEFNEANLLFAAMEKNVWNKAVEDTTALHHYYQANKQKYIWQPSVNAIIFSANNKETALKLKEELTKNMDNWRKIIDSFGAKVAADSSRFEIEQLSEIQKKGGIVINNFSELEKNANDESCSFIYYTSNKLPIGPRSFDDAKGLLINDYQQVLEKNWLNSLQKKYPIKFNEAVWKTIK
ncbi:MAG: peptidylprolyl isomerase [Chitinophagaceae bacterium]